MKILILNWRDPWHPLAGGAEIMVSQHAKYWKNKGASICWYTSSYPGAKKNEIKDGIKFIREGSEYTVHCHFFINYIFGKISSFDIVIDCFHFIPFFTPLFIKKRRIIAVIHEIAGKIWFLNTNILIASVGYLLEPLIFILYRKTPFITVSESTKKELVNVHVSTRKIHLIENGVIVPKDITKLPKTSTPILMYLGRLVRDKGIQDVLEVFNLICISEQEVKLWIVGEEQQKGDFLRLVNKSSIKNKKRIVYFGFVDEKTKFELLEQAWLVLNATKKEGWGLTVIEAASQATPTVGYNVEGLRDSIVHEQTGLLTEPNPKSMAVAVLDLLKKPDKLRYMQKNALLYSKKFDWQRSGRLSWDLIFKDESL